jgi:hypothetical protein
MSYVQLTGLLNSLWKLYYLFLHEIII